MTTPRTRGQRPTRAKRGSVRADEVLPLCVLSRRLGIGRYTLLEMRKKGLHPIKQGHGYFFLGADVLRYFQTLAAEQLEESSK